MSRAIVGLSGATGFVGSHVARALENGGYELWPLVRKRSRRGRKEIFYDYARDAIDEKALRQCDAVIHLAGKNIKGFWSSKFKRELWDSRVLSTRLIANTMARLREEGGPRVLICASAVGYYGDGKEEELDEKSPKGVGFLADLCEAWELETRVAEKAGVRVVNTRFGTVLGLKGGMLQELEKVASMGLLPVFGSGQQYMALIGMDDLLGALLFVLKEDKIAGPVNIVCPKPLRNKTFTKSLVQALRGHLWFSLPSWLINLFGEQGRLVLDSCRAVPRVLLDAGFKFSKTDAQEVIRGIYTSDKL